MTADAGGDRLLPLGTGSILMGGRSAAGYLLDLDGTRLLIDPGPGSLLRLDQAGIAAWTIPHVLLSHFHPDHHADLLGLLFQRRNPSLGGGLARLVIHGPPGLKQVLAGWRSAYAGKGWIDHPEQDVIEVRPGAHRIGGLAVHALPAKHTMPAYCFRFETAAGRAFAYSGDSDECDDLVAACRGADLVWLECSFPDEREAAEGHLTPARIRRLLDRARPTRAALTHFYPPMLAVLRDRATFEAFWRGLTTRVEVLQDLEAVRL